MAVAPRRVLSLACVSPVVALALMAGGCQKHGESGPGSIEGRYIAVLCDADMSATAFADGMLARTDTTQSDALTVVPLPIALPQGEEDVWQTTVAQVPVSNSVMGPPVSIAVTPDGNTGYIVESQGPASPTATRVSDLPAGRQLTAVCLEDPRNPHKLASIDVGANPTGVDVSPDGRFVAVVLNAPGAQLVIVRVSKDEPLSDPYSFPLPGIDAAAQPTSVQWHKDGRHLAVTLPGQGQVAFFEFNPDIGNNQPGIAPWGRPVSAGKYPVMGKFSPDGKLYFVADAKWGNDVPGFLAGPAAGEVLSIALSPNASSVTPEGDLDLDGVVHEVSSVTTVGVSPESLAVSPDGRFVVTANLRGSFLSTSDSRFTPGGSLSLMGVEGVNLVNFGEFPINAMPEGLAFDRHGRHVVVSQFKSFDPGAVDGELAFFRVVDSQVPQLEQVNFWVGVGVGPHGVLIVR